MKRRECNNPTPKFGGRNCSELGDAVISQECNTQPCPIDGGYTDWTPYSKCSKSCGGGIQYRSRCCVNPIPAFGGKPCILLGEPVEVRKCGLDACPINGNWGEWGDWGTCSGSCGSSAFKLRKRECNNPPAMFGGQNCPGDAIESMACNSQACPVNGGLSEWSSWTGCSATCGPAIKTRDRSCTNPAPANGGNTCVGSLNEVMACSLAKCAEYHFGVQVATWDAAEAACVAWGGHLASIVDMRELNKIVAGFANAGVAATSDEYVWIGLQDKVITNQWTWIDGTQQKSFMPWGNGEPSHSDHHCVSMNLMTKTWWDRNCPTLYRYVCKK